jgi:MFS family permease
MQGYISLLRRRPGLRNFWISQVISWGGDWFNTIATAILVNRYTDSAVAVSLLFLARSLPLFLVTPYAGVIADRFSRKQIIIWSNFLRAVVVLGFLLVDRPERLWMVYFFSVLQFILSAFFEPAQAALLPSLIDVEEIQAGNSLANITWSAMLTLGAGLGGLVAGLFGVTAALLIDAASFVVAGSLVMVVKAYRIPPVEEVGTSGFIQGFQYVRRNRDIALLAAVKGLTQVGSVDIMITVYADRVLVVGHEGATTLGVLFASHGFGAIFGPLIGDNLGSKTAASLENWISLGFVMVIIGWLGFGLAPTLPTLAVAMFIRGAGGSINWTYSSAVLQMRVPDNYLGRVFGLDFTIFTFMLSLSLLLSGIILDTLHVAPRDLALALAVGMLPMLIIWITALSRQRSRAVLIGSEESA